MRQGHHVMQPVFEKARAKKAILLYFMIYI